MNEKALPRRIMYVTAIGQWKMGRPKACWEVDVGKDVRILGVSSCWSTATNREEWRQILRDVKTLKDF
jgi:hypothetical protein